MMIILFFFIALMIVLIILIMKKGPCVNKITDENHMEILKKGYVKDEITKEEFDKIKHDII